MPPSHFFWVSTLPARLRVDRLLRPSSRALAALVAIGADVSLEERVWDRALPARDLAVGLAPESLKTWDAARAIRGDDFSDLAIS
jgi:hypothetical protein